MIISFLAIAGISALLVHFVPILMGKGIARSDAVTLAGLMGVGSIVGRIATGLLLDRLNGSVVGTVGFAMPIVALLILLLGGPSLGPATAAAILLGVTLGCEVDVLSYLASRHFGMRSLGALYGVMVSLQGFALGASPVVAGFIFDRTGSYVPLLYGLIPVFAVSAVITAVLGPYPALDDKQAC